MQAKAAGQFVPEFLTTTEFADRLTEMQQLGLKVEVLDEDKLAEPPVSVLVVDDEPSNLILRKGVLSDGIVPNAPGDPATLGTLRRSIDSYTQDTWVHVRLDMIVNGTGDVILRCYQSDLDTNAITAPVWTEIVGMDAFTDDVLGVNTGTVPLVLGRMGFAAQTSASARRVYVDGVQGFRQIPV